MKYAIAILLLGGITLLSGCFEDADQIPKFDPKLAVTRDGYYVGKKTFIANDMKVHWSQQAITNRSRANYSDIPRKAIVIKANQRCNFSKNLPTELVRGIFIEHPRSSRNYGETAPIFSHSKEVSVKVLKEYLEHYKRQRKAPKPRKAMYHGTSMDVVDVVVTDTSGPIRLVLQVVRDNVLWNIQTAANVNLSRVAVLSHGDMIGVANVPESTKIEILTGKELKSCGVELAREPQEHWGLFRGTQGVLSNWDKRKIAELRNAFNKYNNWFKSNFSQSASQDAISLSSAEMVLIGDVPQTLEERLEYKRIRDSLVFVSAQDELMIGDPDEFKKLFIANIQKTAAKILGVDVSSLQTK